MQNVIDFVIPWVNGDDPAWQEERNQYESDQNGDSGVYRYRDLTDLKFIFRGIEKHAPWVNKIYFVTWGHVPDFLKVDHPKIQIIRHGEFIPKEYLPTFSSHPIELNLHRIEGLSEQFVYFNDDIFLVDDVKPEDFFRDGLPCDQASIDYITSDKGTIFPHILLNNIDVINRNFSKEKVMTENKSKWFSKEYGIKAYLKNLYFKPIKNFSGIKWHHSSSSFLKSTFEELWNKEYEVLNKTSLHKFRNVLDVNQYVMRNWQLVSGRFNPVSIDKISKFYNMPHLENQFINDLDNKAYKIMCVNDSAEIEDFESLSQRINDKFEVHFPNKSSFEK